MKRACQEGVVARSAGSGVARVLAAIVLCSSATAASCARPVQQAPQPLVPVERVAPPEDFDGPRVRGNPNAAVVVWYWFDYQCVHCVPASEAVDQIASRYGDRIAIHYLDFPLRTHPYAHDAAVAAEAARRQGRYFEMHRLLMARSPDLGPEARRAAAAELGLDLGRFDADVLDLEVEARVDRDRARGDELDMLGVPTIFINGVMFDNEPAVAPLSDAIDAALPRSRQGHPEQIRRDEQRSGPN